MSYQSPNFSSYPFPSNELEYYDMKINKATSHLKALKNEIEFLENRKEFLINKNLQDIEKIQQKPKLIGPKDGPPRFDLRNLNFKNRYRSVPKKGKKQAGEKKTKLKKEDYEDIILNEKIIKAVGTGRQLLENFVDRVAERSLFLYRNQNCHTCSKELRDGNHALFCAKYHQVFGYN